jgi:hypothetical protein
MLPVAYINVLSIEPVNLTASHHISGWVKIHSITPHIIAHDPNNLTICPPHFFVFQYLAEINSPPFQHLDMVLQIDPTVLNRVIPQLQITSWIWISGLIAGSDNRFTYVSVRLHVFSLNVPLIYPLTNDQLFLFHIENPTYCHITA